MQIADAENLTVSQAELSEYLVRQAPQYGMTPDAFAQALAQSGQVASIFGEVRRAKALSLVLEPWLAALMVASGVWGIVQRLTKRGNLWKGRRV